MIDVDASLASRGSYDDIDAAALADRLGVPAVIALASAPSTLDVAHALASEGAPSGTLVLADEQTSGRGRGGRQWTSLRGAGIWLTLIERNLDPDVLALLALRLGIAAAAALDPLAPSPIRVKWPNDLWTGAGKLAGILAEARWRDGAPEWVAIGIGVNVIAPPGVADASGLQVGVRRERALCALVPALREAAARRGPLTAGELDELARRDLARGRALVEPSVGRAEGVAATGELLIRGADGALSAYRSGSLVFAADP